VRSVRPVVEQVVSPAGGQGERNVWFVGDDSACAVIDPAGALTDLAGHYERRRPSAILWTSLWPGSVATALTLADQSGAVTYLPSDELVIWRQAEPERRTAALSSAGPGAQYGQYQAGVDPHAWHHPRFWS
jgi:hypothetical protein